MPPLPLPYGPVPITLLTIGSAPCYRPSAGSISARSTVTGERTLMLLPSARNSYSPDVMPDPNSAAAKMLSANVSASTNSPHSAS